MAGLNNKQKKEWAENLYTRQGLTGKEIAAKVGATEKTISDWKTKGKWDTLKASLSVTKAEQLQNVYAQMNELNTHIRSKEEGRRFASTAEADTLSKLAATAKNLESEASIADIVDSFVKFNEFIRTIDLEEAKRVAALQDAFIKTLLK